MDVLSFLEIQFLLRKYGSVIVTLWELAENGNGEAAVKVRGLHDQLEKGAAYLGLLMCKEIPSVTDGLIKRRLANALGNH